jgi:hypothetical protein
VRKPGSITHVKRLLRRIIYGLKWQYGFPADLYRDAQGEYDPGTGKRVVGLSKIHVDRMIVFPGLIHRDFFFSISVIRANSQFITGGDIELTDRQFIIDGRDLPLDYEIDINDYIVKWDSGKATKWDIKSVEEMEGGTGYFIVARRIDNEVVRQVHELTLRDTLVVTSEFDIGT